MNLFERERENFCDVADMNVNVSVNVYVTCFNLHTDTYRYIQKEI